MIGSDQSGHAVACCPVCRDHSVQDGLDYVATWNSAMLPQSADLGEVFAAKAEGRKPAFSKL